MQPRGGPEGGRGGDSWAATPSPLGTVQESGLQDVVWGTEGQRKGRAAEKRNGEVTGVTVIAPAREMLETGGGAAAQSSAPGDSRDPTPVSMGPGADLPRRVRERVKSTQLCPPYSLALQP